MRGGVMRQGNPGSPGSGGALPYLNRGFPDGQIILPAVQLISLTLDDVNATIRSVSVFLPPDRSMLMTAAGCLR